MSRDRNDDAEYTEQRSEGSGPEDLDEQSSNNYARDSQESKSSFLARIHDASNGVLTAIQSIQQQQQQQEEHSSTASPPVLGGGIVLKDYQIIGFHWMSVLRERGIGGILGKSPPTINNNHKHP